MFSLKLRNDKFVLAQKLEHFGLIWVYNYFNDQDCWESVSLKDTDALTVSYVTKAVLKRSITRKVSGTEIIPLPDLKAPPFSISNGTGFRNKKFWENTDYEREILVMGGIQKQLRKRERVNGKIVDSYTDLSNDDYDSVSSYDMANIRAYPEFNERLYLSCEKGYNYDPLKEIAFDKVLDLDCLPFIDILSGKVEIEKFGY